MRTLLILVFFTILFQSVFAQKQKLGLNLVIGQTYYQTMKSSTSISLKNTNGPKVNFDLIIADKIAFTITDFKDNIYNITASFQQLSTVTKLPFGGDINYSSDRKDEKDTFSNVLNAVIGRPFLIKMTTLGKILEVRDIDSIFQQALEKFPGLSLEQKLQFKGQFMESFGENHFRENFEMVTLIYSNMPVEKGDSWTIKRDFEPKGNETFVSTYDFKNKAENYNLILGNGSIETLNNNGYTKINGMLIKSGSTGAINSSLQVDSNSGWIIDGKINELISGSTQVKDNPESSNDVKQTITVSIETTYTSK